MTDKHFSLDKFRIDQDLFKTLTNLTLVSDASEDIIIQPKEIEYTLKSKKDRTMANPNPFATLKYAIEVVPFFNDKTIPLTYFIEGCEEAKSMLSAEIES